MCSPARAEKITQTRPRVKASAEMSRQWTRMRRSAGEEREALDSVRKLRWVAGIGEPGVERGDFEVSKER